MVHLIRTEQPLHLPLGRSKSNHCPVRCGSRTQTHCTGAAQPLNSRRTGAAQPLHKARCTEPAVQSPLHSRCRVAAQPLQSRCRAAAEPLQSRCRGAAQALHRRCTGAAQPLQTHCRAAAQPLQSRCKATGGSDEAGQRNWSWHRSMMPAGRKRTGHLRDLLIEHCRARPLVWL